MICIIGHLTCKLVIIPNPNLSNIYRHYERKFQNWQSTINNWITSERHTDNNC